MVPGVGADLVALLHDALLDVGHVGDLVADLEEGRVRAVLLEDVEDLGGGGGPGAVVEGERDDLLVADVGDVGVVAGVDGLLGDFLDGLAGDLAGLDGLLAVLAGGVDVDGAAVVAAEGGVVGAGGAVGDGLGRLGVLLVDVGAVGDLHVVALLDGVGAVDLVAVDGGRVRGAAALLGDRPVDRDEVAGGGGGEALLDALLDRRAGVHGLLGAVDGHGVDGRVGDEVDADAHRDESDGGEDDGEGAALLAAAGAGRVRLAHAVGSRGVGRGRGLALVSRVLPLPGGSVVICAASRPAGVGALSGIVLEVTCHKILSFYICMETRGRSAAGSQV